ncbi:MAG: RNA-binding protein [Planctomycetota bacterium]
MANRTLFRGLFTGRITGNSEGAPAYALSAEHALAQYAATGCLHQTFYASAEAQLETLLELAHMCEPSFVARVAVHAREHSSMKDAPALLLAVLAGRDTALFEQVFDRVVDNTKMLRTFVQILRSGVTGRRSFGSLPKRVVRRWLARRTDEQLFFGDVGNRPSLGDIVRMIHPRPADARREALFGYLIGRDHDTAMLPEVVRAYEAFKLDPTGPAPAVPFAKLTSLPLGREHWVAIARSLPWTALRINLNTLLRHGVFNVPGVADEVAARLRDEDSFRRAKAMPYQVMTALHYTAAEMPRVIVDALHDVLDRVMSNVPVIEGPVYVCPDVSGSMHWSVSGARGSASSKVRCVDVAALVAASFLRANPQATVLPFDWDVREVRLDARDTIATNAAKLGGIGGGGTNCSAPMAKLNRRNAVGDLVVLVSDNESWIDSHRPGRTELMAEWQQYKRRNRNARLVCLDVVPNDTTQAYERPDILNVGGFSDRVFEIITAFARGELNEGHWVRRIESIDI